MTYFGITMPVFWLIVMIVLLLIEFLTLGLTTIWFAAGSLCAMFVAMADGGLVVQIVVFAAVSFALLMITRPLAVRYLNSRTTKTNVSALKGRKVVVTRDINNLCEEGQVVVDGLPWTARSSDNSVTFREGDLVRVERVEGVKLIVSGTEDKAGDTAGTP